MLNYNLKSPAWYSGGLDNGALPVGANKGQVWYVNGASWNAPLGDDVNNDGLSPLTPFRSITHAVSVCNDDQMDTIIVLDHWQPDTEVWPIVVDKSCTSIVAYAGGSHSRWVAIQTDENTACFSLQADAIRIVDFYMVAGVDHPCVEFSGTKSRSGIFGCCFAGGTHGVEWGVNEAGHGIEVADCIFCTALTAGGIEISNSPFCMIRNNVFTRPGGVCINVAHDASQSMILNNVIAIDSDVAGRAITLCATVTEVVVDGNSAFWGESITANNPYLDNGAADQNSWGMNHWGNTHTFPA